MWSPPHAASADCARETDPPRRVWLGGPWSCWLDALQRFPLDACGLVGAEPLARSGSVMSVPATGMARTTAASVPPHVLARVSAARAGRQAIIGCLWQTFQRMLQTGLNVRCSPPGPLSLDLLGQAELNVVCGPLLVLPDYRNGFTGVDELAAVWTQPWRQHGDHFSWGQLHRLLAALGGHPLEHRLGCGGGLDSFGTAVPRGWHRPAVAGRHRSEIRRGACGSCVQARCDWPALRRRHASGGHVVQGGPGRAVPPRWLARCLQEPVRARSRSGAQHPAAGDQGWAVACDWLHRSPGSGVLSRGSAALGM